MLPVAPPSPDYVPGSEEPQTPPAPQDEDEHDPMFIQPYDQDFPLPPVVSPTAELPGYVAESDPEEDLEFYEDDETEDGLVDYPMDGGDDGDDDNGDSSRDNTNDEDKDEEEDEEHSALANSTVVIPTNELPVIPPPFTDTATTGARITVRLQTAISLPPEAEMHGPSCITITTITTTSTDAPPIDRRDDIPETEMPPHKRLCLSTLGSRYEVRESSTARPTEGRGIDYGFVSTLDAKARRRGIREVRHGIRDTWIDPAETVLELATMTVGEMQQTEIAELRETDRRRQAQMTETLRVMRDIRREMGDMQAELLALREQPRRAGLPEGDARVPNHQDAPKDADSHI
nr:hypothetical protein [Tanacetum cinerariifolium]